MTFTQAVSSGLSRYFDFRTGSSRSEYWWWSVFSLLAGIVTSTLDLLIGVAVLNGITSLVLFMPGLAVAIRRLHDINRSGWWFLIAFTIIGIVLLIYWYMQPGTRGSNDFGADPLRPDTGPNFEGIIVEPAYQIGAGDCNNCGTPLEQDANFCQSCGAAVLPENNLE
jgi:uncharacterized membrane protein YhaH (DUF805 family)